MKYLFPIALIIMIFALIKSKYKIALTIGALLGLYYIFVSIILARGLS